MSFGISIGDFVTVGKLITDITNSLNDAKSEYQELLRELESLDRALRSLDKLQPGSGASAATLDSIKCAALTCRYPLEEFLRKIERYDDNLGIAAPSSAKRIKGLLRRVDWVWSKKDEIQKLQSYLNIHIGTINMLLLEHGLENLDFISKQSEDNQQHMQKSLEIANAMMLNIESHTRSQALVMQATDTALKNLHSVVRRNVITPLKALTSMVTRVW